MRQINRMKSSSPDSHKILSLSFFLALVTGIITGGTSRAGDLEDVTAASDSIQVVISKALADEDGALLASIFTEDGAVISPDGSVVRGRMTLRASAALLFMTMGSGEIEINRHNISLIDSIAYETGRFVFRRSGDDTKQALQGSYTAVWRQEIGTWKIACTIGLR